MIIPSKKVSLRVAYCGVLNYIYSDNCLSYGDFIDIVISKFGLNKEDKTYLQLCDIEGFKFDKESFDYLLKIFPTCQRVLYLKKVYDMNGNGAIEDSQNCGSYVKGGCKNNWTPVFRQNCFIGSYPQNTKTPRFQPYIETKKSISKSDKSNNKSIRL